MLKLIRRGKYWHITGSLYGNRIREKTGASDRKDAEKVLAQRIGEITSGSTGVKSFAQACDEYRRTGRDLRFIDQIEHHLGSCPVQQVTQELIDRVATEAYGLYKRGPSGQIRRHSPATLKRQFYIPIAAVLHKASELGWCPYRKIRTPKVKRPPPKWAEPKWFEKLWRACDPDMKRLTMFLMMTGCRISECLALEWDDIDLKRGSAFIRKTKTGAHRTAYLPPKLVKVLGSGEGKVFRYRDRRQVGYFLKKACIKAKIPYLSTHQLGSHTFATYMRKYAGADARTLVDTGRWADARSAEHYTHTAVSASSRKAGALDKLFK